MAADFELSNCLLYHLSRVFTARSVLTQIRFNVGIARTLLYIFIPSTEFFEIVTRIDQQARTHK